MFKILTDVTYLTIVFEPFGCNSGNSVVFVLGALGATKGRCATGLHGVQELFIAGFLEVDCLFYNKHNGVSVTLG